MVVLYVLMGLTAFGMLYAIRQYNTRSVVWGRPLAGFFGIVTLALTAVKLFDAVSSPAKSRNVVIEKEQRYLEAAAEFLGTYIATNHPGSRILLIRDPITPDNERRYRRMTELLKRGLAERASIDSSDSPMHGRVSALSENESISDEDDPFTAVALDLTIERHSNCNLVISLIGLPPDYRDMRFWELPSEKRPKLIILFGNPHRLKNAIETGYISAIITFNPKFENDLERDLPRSAMERFFQRFLLINRENIHFITKDNPRLFAKEES